METDAINCTHQSGAHGEMRFQISDFKQMPH
jgi:hypothetical protein